MPLEFGLPLILNKFLVSASLKSSNPVKIVIEKHLDILALLLNELTTAEFKKSDNDPVKIKNKYL